MPRLIEVTNEGLFCEAGGFHVDPWRPVERALLTHAHGDHARAGSRHYLTAAPGLELVRARVGAQAKIDTLAYGEVRTIGDVRVSLHPAGHVLGSAQVRLEHAGEVWVASGDYKTESDPTCAPFEPVRCDVFLTEATFALPVYRWPSSERTFAEIGAWWRANQELGRTSVLFAYALGKAERVLAGIDATIGPLLLHGAVARLVELYRASGIALPEALHATPELASAHAGRALVIAPPSARGPWLRKFGELSTAFASGWMQLRGARRRRNLDRGFALSDHADWEGLLATIAATGAREVLVTHGYTSALSRYLRERGWEARELRTEYEGEGGEEARAAGEESDAAGDE